MWRCGDVMRADVHVMRVVGTMGRWDDGTMGRFDPSDFFAVGQQALRSYLGLLIDVENQAYVPFLCALAFFRFTF